MPERLFLMIDGGGDPNNNAVWALWWVDDWETFNIEDKFNWQWTAMICQPQEAGRRASLLPAIADRKKLVAGDKVRLGSLGDGLAAQILHLGPYAEEAPTIEALHRFIDDHGYELRDKAPRVRLCREAESGGAVKERGDATRYQHP